MDFLKRYVVNDSFNREYYKVYNKKGEFMREIDVQDEGTLTNEYLHGVTCFVVNDRGEVLIEVRASSTQLTPGKLDLVSGHVNGNEASLQAVVRELSEEVGMQPDVSKITKVSGEYAKPLGFKSGEKIRNFFIDFYCVKTKKEDFKIQKEEVEKLKWVPMEEAFEMIRLGKTKFPKQSERVNYEEIFNRVREICLNKNPQEKKVLGE